MRIKRYLAKDMRQALRLVREEQGPDAVILSSQRTEDGVEVTAAVDYEATVTTQSLTFGSPAAAAPGRTVVPTAVAASESAEVEASFAAQMQRATVAAEQSNEMNSELKRLRQMLETQVATLAWNDLTRRAPVHAELLRELTHLGLGQELVAEITAQAPRHFEFAEAHRQALAQIAKRIDVVGDRYLETGGMLALVGPTGAGKTTTLAKLAARWVLRHGPRDIALVAADSVRIGAQDQIHTLGRLLGVTTYSVDGAGELAGVLTKLSDRRLVLVDTAGLSPKDVRHLEEITALASAHPRLESILVLSASVQAGAIEEAIARYGAARPRTCVLTKLDEATSLGGLLSALIRSRIAVAYVSEGQRVPEDLAPARAHQLIVRAVELSRRSGATADEELLHRRFGGVAHALA
ncbi:MAG: flagellar biosynthesis protein FlhF [Steroidobacteraceae bacterium]